MTVASQTPPLRFGTVAEAIRAVRARGMRVSTARRLILEALFAAEGPVSAAHLARTLSIDESSVYRNLEVLERHGLIRHVHLGHGPGLHVLVGRHELEYLYCERCAKVTPIAPEQLGPVRKLIKERFGYEARFTHFAIVGLCSGCAAQREAKSVPSGDEPAVDDPHRHDHIAGADHAHDPAIGHAHAHSHGDRIHSHPH